MVTAVNIEQRRAPGFNPRLSIGLPVYNGERWLTESLHSLLGQSFGDFALIISDNGSTDGTQEICETYATRDTRIRYVHHDQNRGVTWNWNWVFEVSTSEYFKWAACDDVYHPAFLKRCIEILDENPDVAWCHTRSRHVDANGVPLVGGENSEISYVPQAVGGRNVACRTSHRASDRFKAILLGRGGCLDCHAVIRSDVLRKTRLYLPYFGSEKVLMSEIALLGRHYEVPEVLYDVRIHDHAAGNLRSKTEQRRFIDPAAKVWRSDRLGLLWGYVQAVHRAEISTGEQLRCYAAIAQYLLQVRKWKSVVQRALTGAGVAGPYPAIETQRTSESQEMNSGPANAEHRKHSLPELETVP